MPVHQRTKSGQRASSLPPNSPPLALRQSNAAREKARRTPIAPSARRKYALETLAEVSFLHQLTFNWGTWLTARQTRASRHLQAALALLPTNGGPRRSSAPSRLGSPISLRPSMTIREENEDEDMFKIQRPEAFNAPNDEFYASLGARAFDWRQDPFGASPVYVHGQRPNYKHKHKRSSSHASMSLLQPPRLQSTLLSATPSPVMSAANSPAPRPLTLLSDSDASLLMPQTGSPHGWSGAWILVPNAASPGLLSTPSLSTPGLSPSASSASGSPFTQGYGSADYFTLQTPRVHRTPGTPRPVPH
jgi:hypothetical protein